MVGAYDRFARSDGKIDVQATCGQGSDAHAITMIGHYIADSLHIENRMAGKAPIGATPTPLTISMTLDMKRGGACTGSEPRSGLLGN